MFIWKGATLRIRSAFFVFVGFAGVVTLVLAVDIFAQAPARGATQAAGRVGAAAPNAELHGNLIQVMRGVLFPAVNVVFFAQANNPDEVTRAADPATAANPLQSAYGGWLAVENASIALAESANLLMIPGRRCANGRPVPMTNPDWPKFVQVLRQASMVAFKAAQSKSDERILDAAEQLTIACANCHEKWRDVEPITNRCMP